MAVIVVHIGEKGSARTGDAVYCLTDNPHYPLHAGIYVGLTECNFPRDDSAEEFPRVVSLPGRSRSQEGANTPWGSHSAGWKIDLIAQRIDEAANSETLKEAAFLAKELVSKTPPFFSKENCELDRDRLVRGEFPLMISGSCSQFVEYVYECAGLDIIDQKNTFNPEEPNRVYPALQIRAFWTGNYPLRCPWDPLFAYYPWGLPIDSRSTDR